MPTNLLLSLKALRDLGFEQVGLNALYKLGLRVGHYRRVTDRRPKTEDHPLSMHGLEDLPSGESLLALLGADGQRALLHEADEIVGGRVRLFGGEPVPLQLAAKVTRAHWTHYETGKLLHDGDLKLTWEPARFGWATVLARAFYLSRDEKYAETFWNYLGTFLATNPPYRGPNWISAQEAAIRILAWTFAWSLLREAESTTSARSEALAQAMAAHAARIPPTLIYARSQNNNHLLGEAAGLVTAGMVLPDHPRAKKWLALGQKWFNRGLEKQIDGYGEYSQHSTNYHRLMLQLSLWLLYLEKSSRSSLLRGAIFSPLARKNLARASHWLASMLDSKTGGVPNLGANDGAYILPLTICPFADFRPVVQSAARAFLQHDIESGVWDEMSLWFGIRPAGRTFEADHYLADNPRGRESWGVLRTTRFTSRPGHADLLHLDLWWRGLNVTRDAGTFSYNAQPPWDNPLTAARLHNTVTVDGRDQMTRASRFLYVDWANAFAKTEIASDEKILQRVAAYHTGYRRIGVEHQRTVTVFTDERWLVKDRLKSRAPASHAARLHWLLPDWKWEIEERDSGIGIRLQSPEGWVTLNVSCNVSMQMCVARGGALVYGQGEAQPFDGWFSPTYDQKIPALSFAFNVESQLPVTFTTEFVFPK